MRGLFQALAASVSLYVAVTGHVSAAESDRGAQLAATCASCHRLDGRYDGIPSIAGLDADELIGMMQAYKLSEGPSLIMHGVSLSLSADEIAAVARYLAAQRADSTPR
jgi:cytochrome subunit of sulfide dehydrogenase